jgi:membrane fusion protein, multidrug efflux system
MTNDILDTFVNSEERSEPSWSRVYATGISISMAFVGLLTGYIVAKRFNLRDELASKTGEVAAGPFVQSSTAARTGQERVIKELGETRPYYSVTLYAKISGYLSEINVDKGDRVKKGQVLATIYSPETSSAYEGALANSINQRAISKRMRELHRQKVVSDEDAEQAIAQADIATAKMEEASAKKGYTIISAPFDGTVTARYSDPGALIQAAASEQASALPVVTVSQTEKLRVTVFIDQRDAAFVQVGDPAKITVTERRGVEYDARVTRKAGELDARSRTMLTEIELDNPHDEIVAGSFVDVSLKIRTPDYVQVPSEALVMQGPKPFLAVISEDGTIHYRSIVIGDNDGTKLSVVSGLEEGELVALNLGNNLIDGQHVQTNVDPKT